MNCLNYLEKLAREKKQKKKKDEALLSKVNPYLLTGLPLAAVGIAGLRGSLPGTRMGYNLLSEKLKRSGNGMAQRLGSMMRKDKYTPSEIVEDYLKTSTGTGKTPLSRPILGIKKLIKKFQKSGPESLKGETEHWSEFTADRERAVKQWLAELEIEKFNKDNNKYYKGYQGSKKPVTEYIENVSTLKNNPYLGYVVSPARNKFKRRIDNVLKHVGNNYNDFVNIAEKVDPGVIAQMAATHAPVFGPYTTLAAGGLGAGVLGAGLTGKGIYDHLKNKENTEGSPLAKTAARKKNKESDDSEAIRGDSSELGRDIQNFARANALGALGSMAATPLAGAATTASVGSLPALQDTHLDELLASTALKDRVNVKKPRLDQESFFSENAHFSPYSENGTTSGKFSISKGEILQEAARRTQAEREALEAAFKSKKRPDVGEIGATSKRMWKPGIVAHELGHADIHANPGLVNFLQKKLYQPTMLANKAGLGVIPALGAYMLNKEEEDPLKGALKGGLVGATANAGALIPEFEASRRGIKHLMKSSLPTKQKVLNSLTMLPAFSTYLLSLAGPSAVAGAMSSYSHKKKKERKAAKEKKETKDKTQKEEFTSKVANFIKKASNDLDELFNEVETSPKKPLDGRLKKNKPVVELKENSTASVPSVKLTHHHFKPSV